jgi:hypothetical protein
MSTSTERMRRLRERRAASIEADPDAHLRDADDLLGPAVEETLAALKLGPEHAGAAQLARSYARVIDQARDPVWALRWIGPNLMAILTSLRATPASRASAKPERTGPNKVAQLRAAHAATVSQRQRSSR